MYAVSPQLTGLGWPAISLDVHWVVLLEGYKVAALPLP